MAQGFGHASNPSLDAVALKCSFPTDSQGGGQQPDPHTPYTGEKMLDGLMRFSLLCISQPQGPVPVFLVDKSVGIAYQQLFSEILVSAG